ncbi:hypothetical protein COU61_00800 [Candidatus Pacearchaeota archaeon CG10_big_fil_rev_8_21_14_0_10_35_13]|nr:MAG: hypothetical protein COU61_00800 [Candidatus Pacearchaeota archaeon CG10_big_fil_rev_8_21_14_0_10_35_13]
MAIIRKKCWPKYFELILDGKKKFDVRIADFPVSEGDTIIFEEWNPDTQEYTGRKLEKKVTYVSKIKGFEFFPKEEVDAHGLVIMSLE